MKIHYADNYLINPSHPITINLIGAGGTGSQVLQNLARIDYALYKLGHKGLQVNVYDDDIVTDANIGRQLFSRADIGLNKAEVLVSRVNRFYGTRWDSIPEKYEKCEPLSNITITCVDNVKSRIDIGKYIRKDSYNADVRNYPLYWLDFGNTTNTGQVVLGTLRKVNQPKSKKFISVAELKCIDQIADLTKIKDSDSGPSCSLAEALSKQDLFINSTLSQLGCNILWKLISEGSIKHNGAYLNIDYMKVNPIPL